MNYKALVDNMRQLWPSGHTVQNLALSSISFETGMAGANKHKLILKESGTVLATLVVDVEAFFDRCEEKLGAQLPFRSSGTLLWPRNRNPLKWEKALILSQLTHGYQLNNRWDPNGTYTSPFIGTIHGVEHQLLLWLRAMEIYSFFASLMISAAPGFEALTKSERKDLTMDTVLALTSGGVRYVWNSPFLPTTEISGMQSTLSSANGLWPALNTPWQTSSERGEAFNDLIRQGRKDFEGKLGGFDIRNQPWGSGLGKIFTNFKKLGRVCDNVYLSVL